MKASVRVMRSYDYCHFEITLGSEQDLDVEGVNDLRKQAALLVDEAVRQFKIAKKKESDRERLEWQIVSAKEKAERINKKPQSEWTVEDAAFMRSFEDDAFWQSFHDNDFGYEDGDVDYHFSMLRRFQDTHISAG